MQNCSRSMSSFMANCISKLSEKFPGLSTVVNIPVKWDSISKLLSQMVMIWFFTAMQTSLSLTVDQHLCCRVWFGCWWSNHFAKSIEMSTLCLCSGSLRPVGTGQALHKTEKSRTCITRLEQPRRRKAPTVAQKWVLAGAPWVSCPALQDVGVVLELSLNYWRI